MVESGTLDTLNGESGINNVISQVEITRKAYQAYGRGEKLAHSIFEGGHQWNSVDVYPFFKKYL